MSTVERNKEHVLREYGQEKWPAVLASIRSTIGAGERDLSRAVWSVMRSWRKQHIWEQSRCVLGGTVHELPFVLGWEARQGLVPEVLADAAREDTSLVVELGSGWAFNLFQFWSRGGAPRDARYVAAEFTPAGRECSEELAALDPALQFTAVPFDYHAVQQTAIEPTDGHALVFSCQSIEQIPELRGEVIEFIASLGARVTCVHFEPCGWQVPRADDPLAAEHRAWAESCDYNRNLWDLLRSMESRGVIDITRCVPDLAGPNPRNPVSVFEWVSAGR